MEDQPAPPRAYPAAVEKFVKAWVHANGNKGQIVVNPLEVKVAQLLVGIQFAVLVEFLTDSYGIDKAALEAAYIAAFERETAALDQSRIQVVR